MGRLGPGGFRPSSKEESLGRLDGVWVVEGVVGVVRGTGVEKVASRGEHGLSGKEVTMGPPVELDEIFEGLRGRSQSELATRSRTGESRGADLVERAGRPGCRDPEGRHPLFLKVKL